MVIFIRRLANRKTEEKLYMKHMHQIDVETWVDDALDLIYNALLRA